MNYIRFFLLLFLQPSSDTMAPVSKEEGKNLFLEGWHAGGMPWRIYESPCESSGWTALDSDTKLRWAYWGFLHLGCISSWKFSCLYFISSSLVFAFKSLSPWPSVFCPVTVDSCLVSQGSFQGSGHLSGSTNRQGMKPCWLKICFNLLKSHLSGTLDPTA